MTIAHRPVYFAGGDLVSTHGSGVAAAASACMTSRVIVQSVRLPNIDADIDLPYCPAPATLAPYPRLHQVARNALTQAGLDASRTRRAGIYIGTSSGDIALHEQRYADEHRGGSGSVAIRRPYHGEMAEELALALGIEGSRFTFSTACSASANALLYAAWAIREGQLDDALVLGVELRNRISLSGFSTMLLVARNGVCRPFDAAREGIVLGEAVAATVLSATPSSESRWRLCGGGTRCDAAHPTNPAPEKIAATMRQALVDSGVAATDIVAIKAHGTGTISNDQGEAHGIRQVFDDRPPPFTSIKPVLGHTLGACGVTETITVQRCVEQGQLPATAQFETPDPALGIAPLRSSTAVEPGPLLLNFFGFGGNNCSLVVAPC